MNMENSTHSQSIKIKDIRISKCLSHTHDSYTYLGTLLESNDKVFVKSYKYSSSLLDCIKHRRKSLEDLNEKSFFQIISVDVFNDRIFTIYDQYISTLQADIDFRAKSNAYYNEYELKKIISVLLRMAKVFAENKSFSLCVKDISLEQVKILSNFDIKVDIKLEEILANSKDGIENSNNCECKKLNVGSCMISLRVLVSKIIFLKGNKKFNAKNFQKLKNYFIEQKQTLAKHYSLFFLQEINDLLFDKNTNPLKFQFYEAVELGPISLQTQWETLDQIQRKWYSLSEATEAEVTNLLKIYNGAEPLAHYYYPVVVEELDFGPLPPKKKTYSNLLRAQWINKINGLTAPGKWPIFCFIHFMKYIKFTNLHTLDLSRCKVTDQCMKILTYKNDLNLLESISIQSSGLSHKGFLYLAQSRSMRNLRTLTAIDNGFGGDIGLKHITNSRYLQNLEKLSIYENNEITDEGIRYLSNGKQNSFKEINLESCNIRDEALRIMSNSKKFEELQFLNLSHTKITHKGLEEYAKSKYLTKIEILDLNECPIGDLGVEHLKNSKNVQSLQYLFLVNCRFTPHAISILKQDEAFKGIKGIRLGSIAIDPDGKGYSAI